MPSSSECRALVLVVVFLAANAFVARAEAQPQQAQGFALDRFYPSAPGGGWFVMDALDMRGDLGGAMALTSNYARNPLRIPGDSQPLALVSDRAVADFGFAVTYDRWRLYLNLDAPLLTKGSGGSVGDYQFTAPAVDLGSKPDTLSDVRLGLDARLVGGPMSAFRLGASAQIFIPEGNSGDYDTDGTVRAMLRALVAGDRGLFTYAGQLGVHIRPLDDSPAPGSPEGSELLFGLAAGARLPVATDGKAIVVIGPELYGETAFESFFGSKATGFEGLLTSRIERAGDEGAQVRVKLASGGGISAHFGAPEWRALLGVEVFDRSPHKTRTPETP